MYLHAEWKFIKGTSWTSIKFSETLNKNIQKWIQTMGSKYEGEFGTIVYYSVYY